MEGDGKQPWGFDDDEPKYRSYAPIEHGSMDNFNSLGGSTGLDQPVTRSLGVMQPEKNVHGSYWGDNTELDIPMPGRLKHASNESPFGSSDPYAGGFPQKTKTFDQFASKFQGGLHEAVLEKVPSYVEKYSSFYSSTQPFALLNAISAALSKVPNMDHEVMAQQYRIKGVVYLPSGQVSFQVQCYDAEHEGFLCEFQRRFGNVTDFAAFFRQITDALGNIVTRLYLARPADTSVHRSRANLMRSDNQHEMVTLDVDTIKSLCEMAMGPSVEMKREAVRALAAVTNSTTNQQKLLEYASEANTRSCPCLMKVLSTLLSCNDDTSVRYAAQLLSHISSQVGAHRELLEHETLMEITMALLDSPSALANRDTKRLLTNALATLSQERESARKLQKTQCCAVLEKYRECSDSVLQANVGRVLAQLSR